MRFSFLRPGLLLAGLITLSAPSFAQTSSSLTPVSNEVMTEGINIPEGPVDAAFGLIEILTGRTVLKAQGIPPVPFSLQINQPVTPAEALLAIETTLMMNGVAVAPLGDKFVKVVPLTTARMESPELIEGSTLALAPSGRIATKLFTFNFVRATEFAGKIGNLLNAQLGGAIPFDQANALLITDSISTLQRLEILALQLDQPNVSTLEPKFYPLVYAKASDLANKMRTIIQGQAQQQLGTGTTFNADDRTNQIVLISDPRLYPFFDKLIAKLDVSSDPNTRNEVIYLKHAVASEVATLVTQLVSGQNQAASKSDSARRTNGAVGVQLPNQPSATVAPAQAIITESGANSNEFSSIVTVTSDERSNAVIVSGTVEDIRLIKELLNKIDIVLAQVRIEVVIAEVTLSDGDSTGIGEMGLVVNEGKLSGFTASAAGASLAGLGDLVGDATDAASLVAKNYATFSGWDLNAIISLGNRGTGKSNSTIISAPAVMTTHNKEAHIFSGRSQPTISSYLQDTSSSTTTGSGYRTTVNSQDIGITLTVKPLIGTDGSVQLEIKQEVSDVIDYIEVDGNNQPIVGKREMESFVTAHNGDILVLGGLQSSSIQKKRQRFGPIPLISDLLGSRSKTTSKTDLLIFLRPVVLTNTNSDNAEANARVNAMPIKDAVNSALKGESIAH